MPLMMVCPCGHAAPLPETTGRYRCSKCDRTLEITWFGGARLFEEWQSWRMRTGRVAGEVGERARFEFRPAEDSGKERL